MRDTHDTAELPADRFRESETGDTPGSNLRLFRRIHSRERPVLRRLSQAELAWVAAAVAE